MSEPAAEPITACRRHNVRGPLLATVGWLAAAIAALSVAAIPYDFGESLCGVWGCFPPLPALAAMHLFWCVVFGAGVHAVWAGRPCLLRPLGVALLVVGAATTAGVIGNDLHQWLKLSDRHQALWPQRVGYVLAATTDIPLVQSLAAGVVCLLLAPRSRLRRDVPDRVEE